MKRIPISSAVMLALIAIFGVFGALRASAPQVPSDTWTVTGDMAAGRAGASGTLLPDGRLLVAGGLSVDGATATAERYSVESGAFLATPPMQSARANHSATLLLDGRVLVVGGSGADGHALSSSEIYDGAANVWLPAGGLSYPRSGHTATLLPDGRVLIAGGDDTGVATATLEVFDPASGTFTILDAAMGSPRSGHAAAASGDAVMLIGGFDGTHALASVDVFDSKANTISAGPSLASARAGHSATTLLDGKVLVAGGASDSAELASAEVFDPAVNAFAPAGGSLAVARQHHLAVLLPHNNTVLFLGGAAAGSAVSAAELYIPWEAGGSFVAAAAPLKARTWATGGALSFPASDAVRSGPADGLLVLAGGSATADAANPLKSAALYGFATIKTDKSDYAPGTTVTITGSGWQPGEWVALMLKESPALDEHPLLAVQADDNGNIVSTEFAPDQHDVNIRFYLTAIGTYSQAQTTFTDSSHFTALLVGAQSPSSVNVGGIATYPISFSSTGSGADPVTLSILGALPTGVTASFSPNPVDVTLTSTLTLTTTASTPPGTYGITVRGVADATLSFTTTLVVGRQAINVTTAALGSAQYGSTFSVAATATSGLPVAITTTGGCSGAGSGSATITMTSGTVNCVVHYNQAGNGSFSPATEVTSTTTATKAPLTVTGITANDKVYDKNTTATLNVGGATLVGAVLGDVLTLNTGGATGTFASAAVGANKTVTIAGLTVSGTNSANYALTQPATTASITAKPLTVSGITANNKIYDRTTAATLNTGAATLVGVIAGDTVTLSTAGATGAFADASVGAGKAVTIAGLTITGSSAGNYSLTQPTTTASITAKPLTVSGITANSRPYDQTAVATLNVAGAALVGVVSGDVVTLGTSGATGAFANKNVGVAKPVTIAGLTIGGADAANYSLTQPAATATITALGLTVTGITANDKVYDGATTATLNAGSAALSGVISGDVVTLTGTAAGSFADKNVGTGKTVTVSGLTIGGADAGNYTLTQPTTTASITAKPLTVTGITANNKVYDGTATAALNTGGATLSGKIAADTVTLSVAGATGAFPDKNVGTGRTVTVSGLTIGGTDAGNYTLTQPTTTANITARPLTVTGITANNRPYDQTAAATLNVGGATLVGVVSGDAVTLDASGATGTFANKTVGANKTVTIAGLTIGGADIANYSLTQPTTTASITAIGLTVTGVTASDKVYDGATTATLNAGSAALSGIISGDVVTLTGTAAGSFADKNVGTGKTVTVSGLTIGGADAGNYTLTQPTTTASITAKPLTVTGITANNKVYDGTATATLNTGGAALSGKIAADTVTLSVAGATGAFPDKNAGNGRTVTVSGLTIGGADAGNYTLTQPTTTANITARPLTVTGVAANDKVYDANTSATLDFTSASLSGKIGGDIVTLVASGATGTFGTPTVGNAKTVTVAGLTLAGADAPNYTVTQPTTTANITPKPLTVSGITANNKIYDGTTTATLNTGAAALVGVIAGDNVQINVTGAVGAFSDRNVGNGKSVQVSGVALGGNDKTNYSVIQPTTSANITPKTLTATGITAANKIYDGTTTATLNFGAAALTGKVGSDVVTLDTSSAIGAFVNKNVGNAKTVTVTGLALTGADAGNYVLSATPVTTTASITPKGLTISGAAANSKPYDGSNSATVNFALASLVGAVSGDAVGIDSSAYAAHFDTKSVGSGKPVTVTGVALNGADAGNYTLSQPTGLTAGITALHITGSFTASSKPYDGNTSATVLTRSLSGVIGGDTVSLSGGTASFADKMVGTGKTVALTGATVAGADAGNYVLDSVATTTADITALHITGSFTASTKVYDGNASASVLTRSLSGIISGDSVSLTGGTASFADKTVGNGKTVTLTGATLTGADAGNYVLDSVATTTANITALHITGSFTASSKQYDGTASASVLTRSLSGAVGADNVSLSGGTASFADKMVGTGKTVTLTGATLTGADAGNYVLDSVATTTADITALHVTGSFTVNSKVYDGSASATVLTRSVSGIISGDSVSLTGGTASFADKMVGTGKTVTLTGATLTGPDAGNYFLDSVATTTANITALHVTGSFTASNKPYDGTAAATVLTHSLSSVISGDTVSLSGGTASFADKMVGMGKTVTLTGATLTGSDSGNYILDSIATATADITALHITGSFTAGNKIYDGNTAAVVLTRSLSGAIGGDVVSLTGGTAAFADKMVGTAKTVTLTGATLTGTDAGNYVLDSVATTTADITALHITGSFSASSKIYDGNTSATVLTRSLSGAIGGDVVSLYSGTATFNDKTVATGKIVTLVGATLIGTDAGNYILDSVATTTANITALHITGTFTASDKPYDGNASATVVTRSLSGAISGDVVSLSAGTATFNDKTVANGKTVTLTGATLTGADAGNYVLDSVATTTASITALHITGSFTVSNKVYDGTAAATVVLRNLTGAIGGDVVSLTGGTASFVDKSVGMGKTVTLTGATLAGVDADNYVLDSVAATTANITALHVTGTFTASDKPYDGNASATVLNRSVSGAIAGDAVNLYGGTATFNDKTVAIGKTVTLTGATLTGGDAGNYLLDSVATTTASITALHITGSFTAGNKPYDGNTSATVLTRTVNGAIGGDYVSLVGGTATFADKNAGNGKTVTLTGASLSGADFGNYVLDSVATTTANVAALHVTGAFTAGDKPYDGNTSATVLTRTVNGAIGGDYVSLVGGTATFADKNAGNGKTVTLTGASLSGADFGNYVLDSVAATTASITALHITGSFTASNKPYDGNTSATVLTLSLTGAISGDAVSLTGGTASFADKSVGMGKTVTLTGATLGGTDAGNYVLNSVATTTASITALHITGSFTASNKPYDGNTSATVLTLSLTGSISGDVVSLTGGTATFADKSVGMGKTVTLSGAALSGTDAGNYTLDSVATTTANITALHVTGTFTASDKIYDGNTSAIVLTRGLIGAITGDVVNLYGGTATFNDKMVANGKTVTLAGATLTGGDAGNYLLDSVATATASITPRPLTVTATTGGSKVYDGTTVVGAGFALTDDHLGSDAVTLSFTTVFASKNVGTPQTINVTGISISGGADAGNYSLVSTSATGSANITVRSATWTTNPNSKTYGDGDPNPLTTGSGSNFVAADNVTASYGRLTGETVLGGPYHITATLGPAAVLVNYAVTNIGSTFTINRRPTTTMIVSSPSGLVAFGQPVTFTATVAGLPPFGVPTGSVSFLDGSTPIGSCNPVAVTLTGTAQCTVSNLAFGSHTIVAVYGGDPNYFGSTTPANLGVADVVICLCDNASTIPAKFHSQPIPAGSFVWFNNSFEVKHVGKSGPEHDDRDDQDEDQNNENEVWEAIATGNKTVTFRFDQQTIGVPGMATALPVPNAIVTFDPSATQATTSFDAATNTWVTIAPIPSKGLSGRVFASGVAWQVPTALQGGLNPVVWKARITSDTPGLMVRWTWGAAAFSTLPADPNLFGVKAASGKTPTPYGNGDRAGTPELVKQYATDGGRGHGHNPAGWRSRSATTGQCGVGTWATFTQTEWSQKVDKNSKNIAAAQLAANFPGSVIIGSTNAGSFSLTFSSVDAIQQFLPAGGKAGALQKSETNPKNSKAGAFAGQVLALQLNVLLSNKNSLAGLFVVDGPLAGQSVQQVLDLANQALGGNAAALPAGLTLDNLNDIVTNINEDFDGGAIDRGYLLPYIL